MIIAAHAGTGKTTFAKRVFDAVDFVCMPYKYYLPDGILSYEEVEASKADLSLELRDEWPDNYAKAVINKYNENRYIVMPPIMSVLEELRKEEIPYILCYPEITAKEEYERRYTERGNSDSFLDIFIGGWDRFIKQMQSDPGKYHFVMKNNEYLTDFLPRINEVIAEKETIVSFDLDEEMLENANVLYQKTGYTIQTLMRREMIRVARSGKLPAAEKDFDGNNYD